MVTTALALAWPKLDRTCLPAIPLHGGGLVYAEVFDPGQVYHPIHKDVLSMQKCSAAVMFCASPHWPLSSNGSFAP